MFKLGTLVKDKASGLKGCLTHMQIQGTPERNVRWYNFQPAKLNSEDGTPAGKSWITEDRIEGETVADPADIPIQVLGTEAEDIITGFKGKVTAIIMHISGCLHLEIQPKGSHPKTGQMLPAYDFDIRLLKGAAIPRLNAQQLQESQRRNPGPIACDRIGPRPM